MFGYIYMFTNRENGKRYIGQHKHHEIDQSYFGSGCAFKQAVKKYDIENFKFEILAICNTQEELDFAERHFIGFVYYSFGGSIGRGYNIAIGGDGGDKMKGKTEEELEEWKSKISRNHARYMLGRHLSDDTKRKISEAKTGVYAGENAPWYGKHLSEEHRKKISENHADMSGDKSPNFKGYIYCKELDMTFAGAREAEKYCKSIGISAKNIFACINGKIKTSGFYIKNGKKVRLSWIRLEN